MNDCTGTVAAACGCIVVYNFMLCTVHGLTVMCAG